MDSIDVEGHGPSPAVGEVIVAPEREGPLRMPCGRSDAWAENGIIEIPERRAFISGADRWDGDYKRLDIGALNRVSPAEVQVRVKRALAGARTKGGDDGEALAETAAWFGDVFLVHVGRSCNKQVSGILRFTGDTAL